MRTRLFAGAAILLFGLPAMALAAAPDTTPAATDQSSASDQPGAVTVTARKHKELDLNVPIATTVIGKSKIEQLGVKDFEQIVALIPSAQVQESGFGIYRNIYIRGVGTPALLEESGVGTYADDVFTGGIISNPTQYYDLDRVEVLRGPQGGLYGRDASGGVINFISARPTQTPSESLEATFARYDRVELNGTVNAPVTDTFAIRGTAWYTNQSQGEYYNSYLHQYVDRNSSLGGRIVAVAKPTSDLELTLIVESAENKGPENYYFIPAAGETMRTLQRNTPSDLTLVNTRVTPQVKYNTPIGTFELIGGYSDYQLHSLSDQDFTASPVDPQIITRHDHFDNYFSEFRWFSPENKVIHWTVGANYLSSNGSSDLAVNLYPMLNTPSLGLFSRANGQDFSSYDAFGEVYYDPITQIELAANIRYTNDTKTLNYLQVATGALAGIGGYGVNTQRVFTNVSPGGSITYKPTSHLTFYAKVQTGFRGGGFNFIANEPANLAYDPETSIGYEAGVKSLFWDGRASIQSDIYRFDQTNVLVAESDPSGNNFDYFKNVGNARTYGFEIDGQFRLTEELNVGASLSLMDPRIVNGVENAGTGFAVNLKGHQLPYAPRRTIGVNFDWRHPIFGGAATLVADGTLSDRFGTWEDVDNTVPAGDYDLVNLRLGVEYKNYSATLFGDNVGDKHYLVSEAYAGPGLAYEYSPGSTYGVTLRAHF
jgi:iron complex outermembrane receptor protein